MRINYTVLQLPRCVLFFGHLIFIFFFGQQERDLKEPNIGHALYTWLMTTVGEWRQCPFLSFPLHSSQATSAAKDLNIHISVRKLAPPDDEIRRLCDFPSIYFTCKTLSLPPAHTHTPVRWSGNIGKVRRNQALSGCIIKYENRMYNECV